MVHILLFQAVRRPTFYRWRISIGKHRGTTVLADILAIMANETVTLTSDAVLQFASRGHCEAFLHTAFGLQFGHFGLLWKSVSDEHGSPFSQPVYFGSERARGIRPEKQEWARTLSHGDIAPLNLVQPSSKSIYSDQLKN
jgi:hypothetical protein